MPSVQRAQLEYRKEGLSLLAISLDGDQGRAVKPFLDENKYTVAVALDPDMQVARASGVRVAPWTVIYDRNGNVMGGGYGRIDMLSPGFRRYVRALAAQKS